MASAPLEELRVVTLSLTLDEAALRVCRTQPQRTGRHDSWTGPKITFGAARCDLPKLIIVAR